MIKNKRSALSYVDLNHRHIQAITVLQVLFKQRRQHLAGLNRRLDLIYSSLVSVMNNLSNLYINDVISPDDYSKLMIKLDQVSNQYNSIRRPTMAIYQRADWADLSAKVAYLEYQVVDLIKQCGASNIYDIMKAVVGPNWSVGLKMTYARLLKFYNIVFVPRSIKITSLGPDQEPPSLPDVKMYSAYTESVLIQLYGAELVLPIFNKLLVVKGYFRNDPLNISQIGGTLGSKREQLEQQVVALKASPPIDEVFKVRYLAQISLRDFVSLTVDKLANQVSSAYNELQNLLANQLSFVTEQFTRSKMDNKRKILTLLLLDREQKYAASLIASMSGDQSDQLNRVYKYLHWTVQQIFDKVAKNIDNDMNLNVDNEDVPYEIRIDNLKASELVKRRARDKLKEIKNARDGNEKATKYLDALLRIPFGNFKQEKMLRFLSEFKAILNGLSTELKDFVESEPHELLAVYEQLPEVKTAADAKAYVEVINQNSHMLSELSKLGYDHEVQFAQRLLSASQQWSDYLEQRQGYMDKVANKLECIYGQQEAKRKVQSIIAQWINGEMEGAVFGFRGPPGTGKTSLAKEGLAECLQDEDGSARPFAFIALGGSTNGSILEGHNYTYVGSKWGRMVDVLMETKCMNPIIYFDELDKISKSSHGQEITGILTHLTDPQQNDSFTDRYFDGIKLDLSRVLIIFSYNDPDLVDPILMDRITEVNFKHLVAEEKQHIAQHYMLPKILKSVGYTTNEISFTDEAISHIVESYVYEAGVRQLKEKLYEISRELNTRHMQDEKKTPLPIIVDCDLVDDILERKNRITIKKIPRKPHVGWVNGLYATVSGIGGITIIQVTETFSEQKFSIDPTGSLGDVMKESIKCAKTITWRVMPTQRKKELNEEWRDNPYGLHIHCPSASIKKEGPSAGAALTTAVISYLCKLPVRHYIAMTGEIDLFGEVHAIGGLQAKIEGAIRAGAKIVLIPRESNGEEWDDLREQYADKITVVKVDNISQVLKLCLVGLDEQQFNLDPEVGNESGEDVVADVWPLITRLDQAQVGPPPTPMLGADMGTGSGGLDDFKLN